ncbi:MAG: hypothetical protein Fur0028_04260 [Bacteroidales bacterium]|nr:hypothetical protein [Bacteroidales bacterium]
MDKSKKTIFFDESAKDFILEVFDKTVDSEGFIVEKKRTKQRVLTPEGTEIKKNDLAIIAKGSQKFIGGDIISLMKYAKGEL